MTEKSDGEPPDESDPDQKVGYKQPPADKQFKKGKSGNPRGRPKQNEGVPAADPSIFEFLADKETHRKITVREGNKSRRMPAFQAMMRKADSRLLMATTNRWFLSRGMRKLTRRRRRLLLSANFRPRFY